MFSAIILDPVSFCCSAASFISGISKVAAHKTTTMLTIVFTIGQNLLLQNLQEVIHEAQFYENSIEFFGVGTHLLYQIPDDT